VALLERRIGLLFAAFLVLLLLAGGRAIFLGTIKGASLASAAASQQVSTLELPAQRGTIVDRNGTELAVSEPADDVSAIPYLVKDPVKTAGKLAPILSVDPDILIRKLASKTTFTYLARQVPATQGALIEKAKLPGIELTPSHKRVYPHHELASQLLGTVRMDGDGGGGLEYSQNKALQGTDGERRLVKDAFGDSIETRDPKPTKPGSRLELTIDAAIQSKVEQVLAGVGAQYRPKGATAIVMNPNTSEVLALANWPRVDANAPGSAPTYASQDRAVGQIYEPGSTFKAITVAGALEDKKVTPQTPFSLPPQIQVADRTIGESHPRGPVTLTTSGILAQSSNVGAIKIGQELGKQRFDYWVRRFGFGTPSGVDLPGEERGLVLPLNKYSGSSMGNLPIGQGTSVTPMQMAQAYAAIANGGILRAPRVVRRVDGKLAPAPKGRRIISGRTARQLREMLEGVLAPGGTASEVTIKGYQLAGKTGTANKIDPTTGEYSDSRYVASFIGFAPALHPKLLIEVMVDEPQTEIYGGVVAAPAFGQIASFALPYLRIPPG
jgi:cell division protein FtsI/penicillin-binding protein 2